MCPPSSTEPTADRGRGLAPVLLLIMLYMDAAPQVALAVIAGFGIAAGFQSPIPSAKIADVAPIR